MAPGAARPSAHDATAYRGLFSRFHRSFYRRYFGMSSSICHDARMRWIAEMTLPRKVTSRAMNDTPIIYAILFGERRRSDFIRPYGRRSSAFSVRQARFLLPRNARLMLLCGRCTRSIMPIAACT